MISGWEIIIAQKNSSMEVPVQGFPIQAAMVYLTVLRTIYPYADKLELDARNFGTAANMVLNRLRDDTQKFTDQALISYKDGLQRIITQSKNTAAPNRPTWIDYNEYRNICTLTGLDFLATFPYMDPVNYTNGTAKKFLNRHLLEFLDTDYGEGDMRIDVRNIEMFEKNINEVPTGVSRLSHMKFIRGTYYYNEPAPAHVIDGLKIIECTITSIDGYNYPITLPYTGIDLGTELEITHTGHCTQCPRIFTNRALLGRKHNTSLPSRKNYYRYLFQYATKRIINRRQNGVHEFCDW